MYGLGTAHCPTVLILLCTFYIHSGGLVPSYEMGQKEKALIFGFVGLIASASGFAHFYVTQEGYAGLARKQREGPKQQQRNSSPPGGVWKNMGQRRDALGMNSGDASNDTPSS